MVRELWLARHAESVGNVASTRAEAERLEVIPLEIRDADVGLSPTGIEQADALGDWLQPRISEIDTLWSSPYARARPDPRRRARRTARRPGGVRR